MASRFRQRADYENVVLPRDEDGAWRMRLSCCDCGLIHDVAFVQVGDDLHFAMARNTRSTSQHRRYLKRKS